MHYSFIQVKTIYAPLMQFFVALASGAVLLHCWCTGHDVYCFVQQNRFSPLPTHQGMCSRKARKD